MVKNKKIIIIILLVFTMTLLTIKETYSYYSSRTNIKVKSTSANIICDVDSVDIDPSEAGILGYTEIKVVVKNYDTSSNRSKLPFNYVVEVVPEDEIAEYGYNNEFDSSGTARITGSMSADANKVDEYIIQIRKSAQTKPTDVKYSLKLYCTQSN